jgi:hypothetical protein
VKRGEGVVVGVEVGVGGRKLGMLRRGRRGVIVGARWGPRLLLVRVVGLIGEFLVLEK